MYYLNKETPWILQVLPSLLPFSWQERIFSGNSSFQHLHWFCFMLLRQHYVRAFHAPLMLHLSCSQPTKHPPSQFQLHIKLLLSMEKSRSVWGNLPLAWADHAVLAISPWWSWQSYHTCTVKWNQWHWEWWGTKTPLWLQWMLDWALKAKGCFLPRLACDSGQSFSFWNTGGQETPLYIQHEVMFCFSLELTLCEQNINVCVKTSLNPANPLV